MHSLWFKCTASFMTNGRCINPIKLALPCMPATLHYARFQFFILRMGKQVLQNEKHA
jgi:hypothetical protein